MKVLFLPLFAVFFFPGLCHSAGKSEGQKIYYATRISDQPPIIDGNPGDAVWQRMDWETGFIQREPYEDRPSSQETGFKITYDENNLYVLIRAFDTSPDSINRRLARRDQMDGDIVAVMIDSYFDRLTAFTFGVSAAGVKTDFVMTNNGESEDMTWDPVWFVRTSIDDEGWIAEMRIPLSQLRFTDRDNHIWGLQVVRFLHRKEEMSLWKLISRNAPGFVHLFGELHGIEGIRPKKQFELAPYLVAKAERFEKVEGNPFATGSRSAFDAGIDGKIGVTNDLSLDFTINPDFGQVEADPSEVNLTAFETFFPEKRPFFIEGRNITSFALMPGDGDLASQNLFYSRRIGRQPRHYPSLEEGEYASIPENTTILAAFKLTGKTRSGWSLGFQESITARETAEIEGEGGSRREVVEPLSNYLLGRVQKDFNKGNTRVGGMFTFTARDLSGLSHLDYLHSSALTGGLDFQHHWKDRTYRFAFRSYFSQVNGSTEALLRTQTSSARYYQRPDAPYVVLDSTRTGLAGSGGTLEIGKIGGNLNFMAFINWKSPGLELNDLGFLPNSDEAIQILWIGYRITEPFSIFRRINMNLNQWTSWDFGGRFQTLGGNVNMSTQFKNYWTLFTMLNPRGEIRYNSFLRGGPSFILPGQAYWRAGLVSDNRKKIMIELGTSQVWAFQQSGRMQEYNLELSYRPFDALRISLDQEYSLRSSEMQYIKNAGFNNEDRYIFGQIDQKTFTLSLRLNYNLTPNLTVQYWGQPFLSAGDFSRYKYVTDPVADNYRDRFHEYTPEEISWLASGDKYMVDENRDGTVDYEIGNPNFKAMDFRSNMVVRWEYKPGSTLFLVWSQNRSQYISDGPFSLGGDMESLFNLYPHNVFLLKFSYRFGI